VPDTATKLTVPELSLVVLIGASGSGKSTFARTHFKPTEVMSSDACRGLVSDDENDLSATGDAFDVLHFIASRRLARGKLAVVDATSVKREDRKPLVELARRHHVIPVAIVLNLPEKICHERNRRRPDRDFGPHVVRNQMQQLRRSLSGLKREGFRHVFVLNSLDEIDQVEIERQPLWNNRTSEHGPFDIIGDVHGCADELEELLRTLGYEIEGDVALKGPWAAPLYRHPGGRKAIFLGDLVDRGPRILDTVRIVRAMVQSGDALCVPGNHDMKLMRKLRGRDVQITHGLDTTLTEIDTLPEEVRRAVRSEIADFLDSLVSHYVFDDGKLVVAHAGMREDMQGRGSGRVRDFALYGETTGETDEFGLPVRYDWAADYRGKAIVVYGHTPVPEPQWLNQTINIDTGCVFGGRLTALRYPEKELVSVPARRTYYEPAKRFLPLEAQAPAIDAQQRHDDVLDIEDVLGKRIISTRLHRNITIRDENSAAALEVMSRFAVSPKWLIYLPPTMAPCETTKEQDLLEHPSDAFAYYRQEGVANLICEEKHMGSRAVIVVCRDEDVTRKRFGIVGAGVGMCYTRTGRPFFEPAFGSEFLTRIHRALDSSGLWETLDTDWVCLDTEIMPWSAKAQDLLRHQYAPVGSAGRMMLDDAASLIQQAATSGIDVGEHLSTLQARAADIGRYIDAYRRYCWPVNSIADLKIAPFHLLATESGVQVDRDHLWHLNSLAMLCEADEEIFRPTRYLVVDVTDPASQQAGVSWWEEMTRAGGEGMVVKPLAFVARGTKSLVQPALKCRGREYLRIIYGPEYTRPEHLDRLRSRNVGRKRSLAVREFALGVESLERFVHGEPLRRVHECVFGVLALESEPIDPRL
jgi:protein phosphatase